MGAMIFPRTRGLTEGERALAREVFADALKLESIRLVRTRWPFVRAFVPGRWFGRDWVVWPEKIHLDDLSRASVPLQAIFIHELVHVWQAQQGVNLLFAKIRAGDSVASYTYPVHDQCSWPQLNVEQQAMVVEHRFRLSRGMKVPADQSFYARVCPIGRVEERKNIT